jgi:23S rRNA pseudouridine2605 synthase
MHPRFGVEKSYLVQVAGNPTPEDIQKLLKGVYLSEGQVKARSVKRLKKQGNSTWLRIILAEGKNREIRRMLAKLDHKVLRLKRIAIGSVELDNLAPKKSRQLKPQELKSLRRLAARREKIEAIAEPEA